MKLSINIKAYTKNGTLILTDSQGKAVTFSNRQEVQKKVSMVTLGELCDLPKIKVAKAFGYATRKSYYDIREAVLSGSVDEIIPKRTGPQKAPKRTRELEIRIIQLRCKTDLNMYEMAGVLAKEGFDVSARLIGKVLEAYSLSKKTPKK